MTKTQLITSTRGGWAKIAPAAAPYFAFTILMATLIFAGEA